MTLVLAIANFNDILKYVYRHKSELNKIGMF